VVLPRVPGDPALGGGRSPRPDPPATTRIASDPDLGRRAVAIEAIGEIGDPGSLPALLQVLEPLTGRPGTRPARRSLGGLAEAAVLAIGKVGAVEAVPALMRIAFEGDDLALHSAVVHALGLIGGVGVTGALTEIGRTHPNGYVRDQALRTLERVRGGKDDGGES
jgi:HEAT repeat protein